MPSSFLDLDHHHWIWIIIIGSGSSLDLDHHWTSSLDLDHSSIWIISSHHHLCYLMILLIIGSSIETAFFHAGCRPSHHVGLLLALTSDLLVRKAHPMLTSDHVETYNHIKKGWLYRTSYDEKNHEITPVMIQWWWSSSDDPYPVMMLQWWSRSSDDPDPLMMIQWCSR